MTSSILVHVGILNPFLKLSSFSHLPANQNTVQVQLMPVLQVFPASHVCVLGDNRIGKLNVSKHLCLCQHLVIELVRW